MPATRKPHLSEAREPYSSNVKLKRAVGYVRVSTDMQAADGLSLDAQRGAIEHYCSAHGYKLIRICQDVISGAKDQRPGLQEALRTLEQGADVLIVLKFDRLSRSIKHFCELYERYFKDGTKELVAIRESIRLDSSLGRALVGILMVFAQMEREAAGERTRESIRHIRGCGYHFGKIPYGQRAVPSPDNPRFRVLVDDPDEQAVLQQLRAWAAQGLGPTEMARRLNEQKVKPAQARRWNKSLIYNLKLRLGWQDVHPHNQRWHTDEELKERMVELRAHGHTYQQIASILNEQKWVPRKGRRFTFHTVAKLMARCNDAKYLTPRRYLETVLEKMERQHAVESPEEPFRRPGLSHLAELLQEAGYQTPKGHAHWWPAQVQQLLEGRFDPYYSKREAPL
ncbi:MAG: recombinase family protein [Polyangia bacterium]